MMAISPEGTLIEGEGSLIDTHFIVYAIYKHPLDYPDNFVVRKWIGSKPQDPPILICYNIEQARAAIPQGLTYVGPDPIEPTLIETWI